MSRALLALASCLLAAGAAGQAPTLRTIGIDGNLDDWQSVLVNTVQVTRDGDGSRIDCANSRDRDCPVASTGRDLRLFAWTHDATHLYFHVQRQGSESNTQVFWFYMDLDADGLMETGEPVLRVRFQGGNGSTQQDLYRYRALTAGGDPMVDAAGFADGYTLPGTLDPGAIWSEDGPDGGSDDGRTYEERVPWSVLGVSAGTPIDFHVSSSNSANPGNVADHVVDNLGRLGGGGGTLGYAVVSVEPDRTGTVGPGGTVSHSHAVTNTGTQSRRFSLLVESSHSLAVSLYHDADGDGDGDVLMGTDVGGDGDFIDVGDSLDPAWDVDADGLPETTLLAPGETFDVAVVVTAPAGASDLVESTVLWARLASNPTFVRDSATAVTHVGPVIVRFDQARGTLPGGVVSYPLEVCNNVAAETYDVAATSTRGLRMALHADPDCDGAAGPLLATDDEGDGTWDGAVGGDTDANGRPDTGLLASGGCACFVVTVTAGATTAIGTVDTAVVTATGSRNGASATADLTTTVATRIELRPDHLVVDDTARFSGVGKPVFFAHVAVNNGSAADRVDFEVVPPVNDQGWQVTIWSDPDGDGSIADGMVVTRTGLIPPNGGTYAFVVEVEIPASAAVGTVSTTTVEGRSVAVPSEGDVVTDQVVLSFISTYSDPLFAFATQAFAPCDTIYVQASGLSRRGGRDDVYDLIYLDGAGNTAGFHLPIVPDPQGEGFDEYVIAPGDVAGTWELELRFGDETVARHEVMIEANAVIENLSAEPTLQPLSGGDLGISLALRNDNMVAVLRNTTLQHLILDPTGTQYLDLASGTFRPYVTGDVSGSEPVASLAPGDRATRSVVAMDVAYPSEGLYSVQASWVTTCGTVLVQERVTFVVGSGAEDCANGTDDDGDGLADCLDPECALHPACFEHDCGNGLDDDADGATDCADADCAGDPACPEADCTNGTDDDSDGATDCRDTDCATDPACIESDCTNTLDDDGDGDVDCNDADCSGHAACQPEVICDDLIDNDLDTRIDCADIDCAASPACANDDLDGDGVPNADDCAPLDPGAHHVPDESLLFVTVTKPPGTEDALIQWTDLRLQAGSATVTDVASGLIGELRDDRGFVDADGDGRQAGCLVQGRLLPSSHLDGRAPPSNDGFWYLVRARNVCGDSGWGHGSFGNARVLPETCSP